MKANENLFLDDSGNNTENQNSNNIIIPNDSNHSNIANKIRRK